MDNILPDYEEEIIAQTIENFKIDTEYSENSLEKVNKYKEIAWNLFKGDKKNKIKAENLFLELLQIEPNNIYLNLELFYLYKAQGNEKLMHKYLGKALRLNPDEPRCLEAEYYYKKMLSESDLIPFLFKCIEKAPDISRFYRELGITYRDLGPKIGEKQYLDKAIYYLNKAKDISSRNGEKESSILLNNDLGIVYDRKKDYETALKFFKQSIDLINEFNKEQSKEHLYKTKAWVYNAYYSVLEKLKNMSIEPDIKLEEVLQETIKIYNDINKFNKDCEYLDKQNIGYIGMWYNKQDNKIKAEEYLKKAIEIDINNPWNYKNLALLYFDYSKYMGNSNLDGADKCWNMLKNIYNIKNSLLQVYIDMVYLGQTLFHYKDVDYYKLDIMKFLQNDNYEGKDFEDLDEHRIIVDILKTTREINYSSNKKACTRYYLILLYKNVMDLKKKMKVSPSKLKDGVAHYSSINTLLSLVKREENVRPKFRLYNREYMNDPNEGIILLDILKSLGIENIFQDYYIFNKKEFSYSNTYLGSFTLQKDVMQLWNSYGCKHEGCSLVFRSDFFDYTEESELNNYDTNNQSKEKYCLYEVEYTDSYQREENKKRLGDIAYALKRINEQTYNEEESSKYEIARLVIILLDQVRFLFKDKQFEHEKELRIIKFVDEDKVKVDFSSDSYPRLYTEMEKEIEFLEIILGKRVKNISQLSPYLLHSKKSTRVCESSMRIK